MWGNNKGESVGLLPGRRVIGPLLLMGVCTPFVLLVVHTFTAFDGSLVAMLSAFKDDPQGVFMASVAAPTHRSTMALLAYSAFELVLMHVVPGKSFLGPVTPVSPHDASPCQPVAKPPAGPRVCGAIPVPYMCLGAPL